MVSSWQAAKALSAAATSRSIKLEVRRQSFERGFDGGRAAFPEKLNISALNLYVERIRKKREDSIHPLGRGVPIAQAEIRLGSIVEHHGIPRVNSFRVFVCSERCCPMSPPSLDCGGIETDVAVIGKGMRRQLKFTQRSVVIAFHVVVIQTKSEMPFTEIWLKPQRLQRLG